MWNHQRLQLWRDALAKHKVSEVESSGPWAWRASLTGRTGPIEVRITEAGGRRGQIIVAIQGPAGFSTLTIRRQILKLWAREIEVGDNAFDDAFLIQGPTWPTCARLDAAMRLQITRANDACLAFEIGGGKLQVEISERELCHILPLLLGISQRFAEPLDAASMERRIAWNARRDPKAGVRLLNLQLLARERPGAPATLKVLRGACSDERPKIRLRAAIELGDEGRDVLLKIAERAGDDDSCAQAVSHLGSKLPFERARDILARALRKDFLQTARACVEALGHRRAAAIGVLTRVMTKEKGELAAAAALALGTTGEEAAEPPLLKALRSEDSNLREAAATALGRVGSVKAVQPLKDAAERFWLDLGFRRAARQAIAEIHSRLGASPGQLSLTEAEAGHLSLADTQAGQLSLAPAADAAGQLSLPPGEPEPPSLD